MKKLLLALAVGLLVVAGSASMAAAEITVGGEIEVRYDLWKNILLNNKAANFETQQFFDNRILLNVDAKITEGLEAFVELDTDNQQWGQEVSPGNIPFYLNHYNGALGGTADSFSSPNGSVGSGVQVRQAWINAMIPGLPVGVKIGHQPLALGHGIWLDTHRYGSDAILLYAKPMPQLLLAGVYVQGSQATPTTPLMAGAFNRIGAELGNEDALSNATFFKNKNDTKFYAALANYTWMENNTVGFNFTYGHDAGSLVPVLGVDHTINAYNTALVADGTIAGATYKGEVDWLYVNTANVFGPDQDYIVNAWAAMLGASYKVGPATLGIEVAYGTGNDDNRPGIFYNPGFDDEANPKGPNKRQDHAYYTPYNSTSYNYAFLYNDKIGQGPLGSGGGFGFGDGYGGFGLANTGYIKLSAAASPIDRMNVGMDFLWLRASESMIPGQSKDLGWEIDANASYKIYDNLMLDVKGGVFVPGAWYAFQGHETGVAEEGGFNPNFLTDEAGLDSPVKRNTAYGLETKLSVKF